MRLFLDTSVLLSACHSPTGASREIFHQALLSNWILITTPYAIGEVIRNLVDFPPAVSSKWVELRIRLLIMDDVVTIDRPFIFPAAKDRPILFSALAWADVLLTLDHGDFGSIMDKPFYGLTIMKPGHFLASERAAGRIK